MVLFAHTMPFFIPFSVALSCSSYHFLFLLFHFSHFSLLSLSLLFQSLTQLHIYHIARCFYSMHYKIHITNICMMYVLWWLHIYFTLSMIFPRPKKVINYIYFIVTNAPSKRWMIYIWETWTAERQQKKNSVEIHCQGKYCWWFFFIFLFDFHHGDVLDQFIEMGKLFLLSAIMWEKNALN